MKQLLNLAWRNMWRNRRRSLITMSAIVFAMLITTLMRSLQYGTYDALESYAVNLFTGEVQIHAQGYQDERTFTKSLVEGDSLIQSALGRVADLQGSVRRISGFGLLSSHSASMGAMIIGISPEEELSVTTFSDTSLLVAGQALTNDDSLHVVLGKDLAGNLKITTGDSLVIITQGYRNEMGADIYIVKGLIQTGSFELDRTLTIMPIKAGQSLFAMEGRITEIICKSTDFRKADTWAAQIQKEIGPAYEVLSWREMLPELEQTIALDNIGGAVFLLFLLIIVGAEILNTSMMGVMERIKEFGILHAIGLRPGQIGTLVFLESLLKMGLALAFGLALSGVLIAILSQYPIPLSEDVKAAMAQYGFITDMFFSAKLKVFLEPFLSISAISFLATLYPSRMASRLSPVEAMRRR